MGARFVNNRRETNVGYVEDFASVDIRELKRMGLIVMGELRRALLRPPGIIVTVDLTSITYAWVTVRYPDGNGGMRNQSIVIEPRRMRLGERWFFCLEDGSKAEILYLVNGRFQSRRTAKLVYRTQGAGDLGQVLLKRNKLKAKVEGTSARPPARGRARGAAVATLEHLESGIDTLATGRQGVAAAQRQRERRKASADRLNEARRLMEERQDRASAWVVRTFTPLVEELRARRPGRPRRGRKGSDKAAGEAAGGVQVQAEILRRLGYLKPGAILGAQLGWPCALIGKAKRRLFFVADLRMGQACIVFIVQDPGATTTQLFRLQQVKGTFGRLECRFVCPSTGRWSPVLAYANGQFTLGPAPNDEPPSSKSASERAQGIFSRARRGPSRGRVDHTDRSVIEGGEARLTQLLEHLSPEDLAKVQALVAKSGSAQSS